MIETMGRVPVKRAISFLLVASIIWVYCISNNLAAMINHSNGGNLLNVSSEFANLEEFYAKKSENIRLAETNTELGKMSTALRDGYTALAVSYKNKNSFSDAVNNFSSLVTGFKEVAVGELNQTDNGSPEYNEYRTKVLSDFSELESYISELDTDNAKTALDKIQKKVASEKPYIGLAGELPFNEVSNDAISFAPYVESESINYKPENINYSQSNLAATNDTELNEKIRSEFEELTSVLDVYQFIKNNYMPEFYYGSRKGAIGAYEQKSGNAYDLSSLLIGVLRERGIPARYVRGEIQISAQQAMAWTATDDINVALRIIGALGIPVTALTSNGNIVAARAEHVWVEAYVPYTDYRGAGNQAGESLWIPLDPSFKEVYYNEGLNISEFDDYINDGSNFLTANSEIHGVNIGGIASAMDGSNSALVKYLLENGYGEATKEEVFGGREIINEDLGYLPLTLPYTVAKKIASFDDIPLNLTDSITVSLVGNSAFDLNFSGAESINKTLYMPDIYGKRLTLSYVPATDADADILNKYGGIFKTPAYLLKLKPQLMIDGNVVAEGTACNAGYTQKYTIKTHNNSPYTNDGVIDNSITIGGIYCIALNYGTISADDLQNSADYMQALKATISESNIYTDAAMGEMLNSVAKSYFAQLDMYNSVVAGQNNVNAMRDLSLGIVGFNVNVLYTFNRPAEINEGGIFLDIGRDVHSVISNDNNKENQKAYMLQSGMFASAMEHGILEQMTGIESVSTIKTFEYAAENNIPMHTIAKENLTDELAVLNVSDQIKQEIRSSVNSGKIVIIPEREITINQWSGVGYMVLDTDTFACGYMISGGLAGGSMTVGEMIGEYVLYVVIGAVFIVLWEVLTTILLAMTPCGWLGVVNFLINAAQIIMLISAVLQMVDLIYMYIATGDIYYLQELLVQIAAAATLGIAAKLLGNKLTQLKESITKAIDEAGLGGTCFVAGTPVVTALGLVPIETIAVGDMVQSFDADTRVVSEKMVEEIFVRENSELIHVKVGSETISVTPEHPFYVAKKGFVEAAKLRAGDVLYTVSGEYVVVEQVQHEILESPIKVYNFRVADNHTYFVGNTGIGVHNAVYGEPEWSSYNNKHKASSNVSWKDTVNSTKSGPAKYKPDVNIKDIEIKVWNEGTQVTNGKTWKVMKFNENIGACSGKETPYVRVEMSGNTIHGHPITPAEYFKLIK